MGSTPSMPLPSPDPNVPYFVVCFGADGFFLALALPEVLEIFRRAIQTCWSRGLQSEGNELGVDMLQLKGWPFTKGNTREEASQAKLLCSKILQDLYSAGYEFMLSSDLERRSSTSTWFFQKVVQNQKRPAPVTFCISPSHWDSLQIVGADQSIKNMVQQTVRDYFKPGIEKQKDYSAELYEIQLAGAPWAIDKLKHNAWGRKLLLALFTKLNAAQFRLYATANLKGTADSFFFMHDPERAYPDDRFCMISLNGHDKLGLIECSADFVSTVRQAVQRFWLKGMQTEKQLDADHGSALELQLNGTPWWAHEQETVTSRLLVLGMFDMLLTRGWCVLRSLDINRGEDDKAVFMFRACAPASLPHFCLSLHRTDVIRVVRAPADTLAAIRGAVGHYWPHGILKEEPFHDSHQIVLKRCPFEPDHTNEKMLARVMMCHVLRVCCQQGWLVIASADVSAKKERRNSDSPYYPVDVDSWFLVRSGVAPNPMPMAMAPPSYSEAIN